MLQEPQESSQSFTHSICCYLSPFRCLPQITLCPKGWRAARVQRTFFNCIVWPTANAGWHVLSLPPEKGATLFLAVSHPLGHSFCYRRKPGRGGHSGLHETVETALKKTHELRGIVLTELQEAWAAFPAVLLWVKRTLGDTSKNRSNRTYVITWKIFYYSLNFNLKQRTGDLNTWTRVAATTNTGMF